MRRPTPTQSQLLAMSRAGSRIEHKKRYRRVIGIGLGAAGVAVALVGMDWTVSAGLWGMGLASWAILKAV